MSEASRPKYVNLPGIDTAPDTYETPELAEDVSTIQASTIDSESGSDSDYDEDQSAVSRQRLQANQARNRFQPSRVDARNVDFSDNITAQGRSYRTSTQQRRRRGEILNNSDEEEESFTRKLSQITRKLAALENEYEQKVDAGDHAGIEDQDPKELLEAMTGKIDKIYAAHIGGARGADAILERTLNKFNGYKAFKPSSEISKAIAKQPPLPGTQIQKSQLEFVLSQAADFDKRIAQLENSLGLNGNTMPELNDTAPPQVFTTLTRLEQTMGLIGDASSNNLEAITQQIKKLITDAEHLKDLRTEPSRTGSSNGDSKSLSYPDQEAKINALYGTLPSINKLSPALPLVLERLRTLRLVHTSAWQADEVLSRIESRQSQQEDEIKKWERQLEIVERDIKKSEAATIKNVKMVGDDVRKLEQKLAALLADDN